MKLHSLRIFFMIFLCMMAGAAIFLRAQVVTIVPGENQTRIISNTYTQLEVSNIVSSVEFSKVKTNGGDFIVVQIEDYGVTQRVGEPSLPVLGKLVEIPLNAVIEIEILSSQYKDVQLEDFGLFQKVFPTQPPRAKSDATPNDFFIRHDIYQLDEFLGGELVSISEIGILRGVRLGRLEIAPVRYNPVRNKLRIYHHVEFRLQFQQGDELRTQLLKSQLNPYFSGLKSFIFNFKDPQTESGYYDNAPITFIIVSDPLFSEALQPFVQWKTRKGFRIVQAFTNDPQVGNTPASIRNFLKTFYENPPQGYQPQTFVLLVGDVGQVPSFIGSTGNHVTDLYFAEYTGDPLPDAIVGRFSANNLTQLDPQIQKTLMYEQFNFPNPEFLNRTVLVAGQDAQHQMIWGNGQVNYLSGYYFNQSHGINSFNYLQPEPPGANYSLSIRQNISEGVTLVNYTAHCSAFGWANPAFTVNHVPSLQNFGKYPLVVGNCCSSADFSVSSFAEELLRASGKGAVGYIGGSDNTYWNEDFWWAVGFKAVTAAPVFDPDALGAFDRLWPEVSGIEKQEGYVTQGQMTIAGNLAVTQSGSALTNYYWEIYHLLGDPSLMPYLSQPSYNNASYPGLMPIGSSSFTVITAPYSYVAISLNSDLLGAGFANENGVADIQLHNPPLFPGTAEIIITAPQFKPWVGTVTVAAPEGPYVLAIAAGIDDNFTGNGNSRMDYGETIRFSMVLKNYGQQPGNNIALELSCESEYIEILNPIHILSSIEAGEVMNLSGIFEAEVSFEVSDGQTIPFLLTATDGNSTWYSSFTIQAHAPLFNFAGIMINDEEGNGNGKIEAGEQAIVKVYIKNAGTSKAFSVHGELISTNSYLSVITTTPQLFGDVESDQLANAEFRIYASHDTPPGFQGQFVLELSYSEFCSSVVPFNITAGLIPVLVINLDKNGNSAPVIVQTVNRLGIYADLTNEIPDDLSLYSSIFVTLGIYNSNHVLTPSEGQKLFSYLQAGGKLYLEGGDTWYYDPPTAVHPLFGITGISDGAGDLDTIVGITGTFTEGIQFKYRGENNWIDRLQPNNGAITILRNNNPPYSCGIARIGNGFKTIGTSFEFGGLQYDTLRFALMKSYLEFFEITIPGALNCSAFALNNIICRGDTTQLFVNTSGGSGNLTYTWAPTTGLSDPGSPNPLAFPVETTTYTIEVKDVISGVVVSQTLTIQVKNKPPTPLITQVGQILVSNAIEGNQWYNDDGPIEGARLQVYIPTKTGNYYTIVTNSEGCSSDKSNVIFFQSTFIEEITPAGIVKVYPNPTDGFIHVDFYNERGIIPEFRLVNSFGVVLNHLISYSSRRAGNFTLTFDLTGLPSGVYYLKIMGDDFLITRKILLGK